MTTREPADGRARFALVLLVLIFLPVGSSASMPATPDSAATLASEIGRLRCEARYADALSRARDLLALRRADSSSRPHEITDAERLVMTLEFLASLPDSAQRDLAEADRIEARSESLYTAGKSAEGATEAERLIQVRRRYLGDEHPDVAAALDHLAGHLSNTGDTMRAESLLRESLAIMRKSLGEEHPEIASSLNDLSMVLVNKGDYEGAEPLLRQALTMGRKLHGEEHIAVAQSLNNLAGLLRAKGDYAGAEPLYREALAMRRRLLGDEHPHVALSLNNLATFLYSKGDYAAAEPLYRKSIALQRTLFGDEHPEIATCLNNLGAVLHAKGDLANAEPLRREALGMLRNHYGEEHPHVAMALNNLAHQLRANGDYAGAESLYFEALTKLRRVHGEEHPNVAMGLNNLAWVLHAEGKSDQAEGLHREALAMKRKILGDEHVDVALTLSNLAQVLQDKGDYERAEPLLREALAMRRKLLGNDHATVAGSLKNLATLLIAKRDYAGAESLLAEAAAVFEVARVRAGSDLARATFQRSPYGLLAVVRLTLGRRVEAWPAAERDLGRVLADMLLAAERRPLTPTEKAYEDSLEHLLGRLEREVQTLRKAARSDTTGDAAQRAEESRTRLFSTQAEWGAFQRELAARYGVAEGRPYSLERVQASLSIDEAIVGWLDADSLQSRAGLSSWGYVIRNKGPVSWHALQEWSPSVAVASEDPSRFSPELFRHSLAARTRSDEWDVVGGAEIGERIWRERIGSLEADLAGVRRLIVIPSGRMLGVPVEAIPAPDGVLVGDRFAISYAPSATIFAWLSERAGSGGVRAGGPGPGDEGLASRTSRTTSSVPRCLVLGDPPFSPEQRESPGSCEESIVLASSYRGAPSPFQERGVGGAIAANSADGLAKSALAGSAEALADLKSLPCARREAESVGALFGKGATVLVGQGASEQALARMAETGELQDYRVLHFATHALVDDERPERSALILSQVGLPDKLTAAFAGTRIYDGCVSAEEVVGEWKLDADLVTLSACETGLGRRIAGEGYIGLAHAFLQAGARSLLVSLWNVEDRSTSLLMQRFYENWLGRSGDAKEAPGEHMPTSRATTRAEALQEAKRWLRDYTAEGGGHPYADPVYWAGFILIGDSD